MYVNEQLPFGRALVMESSRNTGRNNCHPEQTIVIPRAIYPYTITYIHSYIHISHYNIHPEQTITRPHYY